MELRARIRPIARRAAFTAALGALLVPATAGAVTADAAAKRTRKHFPVITSISPMKAFVGNTLTVRGRYFRRGRNKNSVVFKRDGGRAIFVKADVGTTRLLKVKLPARLTEALIVQNGAPVPTRLRVRVLAKRFGKRFTSLSKSPLIGPEQPPAPPAPPVPPATGDCDGDGQINGVDTDDDNDLLADTLEASLKLDGCKADTDGDGVEDGYEYRSAQDLNDDEHQDPNSFLPYPAKRPYPNPLDGSDANVDHDGDTLTLKDEYDLWSYTVAKGAPRDLNALTYSAGEKFSVSQRGGDGRRVPTLAAAGYAKQADFLAWASGAGYATVALSDLDKEWYEARQQFDIRDFNRSGGPAGTTPYLAASSAEATYYDIDGNGWLSDQERDEDADGLTNFDETRGCMNRAHWDALYDKETPYYIRSYGETRLDDADSDGDGVRDAADDQDHDDIPNIMECSRNMATGLALDPRPPVGPAPAGRPALGLLNPFNPCLPHRLSRTCNRYPTLEDAWAPFNPEDQYYFVWN